MTPDERHTFLAQLDALHAKWAARRPLVVPTFQVRRERAALWRIALLCKGLLRTRYLPPLVRDEVLAIARECQRVLERLDNPETGR
jgi:hypothetical protein